MPEAEPEPRAAVEAPILALSGIPFTAQTQERAVDAMLAAARARRRMRAHFCNVHTFVESQSDPRLRQVYQTADMVTMDGMPIVWLARWRRYQDVERVSGPDLMLAVCDRGRDQRLKHYMLGGRSGVPEELRDRLARLYPGLEVVGVESPPFRPLTAAEDEAMVERINASGADVLWVGLGAPKQEFWAAEHAARLSAALILPVGAAFDFHSGRVRRAPPWMQHAGLEWLFRLAMEPRRLIGRYVSTNTRFIAIVAREEISRTRHTRRRRR